MGLFSSSPLQRFAPDLLDRLPLGIMVYRLDDPEDASSLRLVYSNQMSEEITGLRAEEEVGRRIVEIIPGITQTDLLERYAAAVRTGTAQDLGLVRYGDARIREGTYRVEAIPLPDRSVAVMFEDVTERTELKELLAARADLEREEARYRSLVEATAAIVWTTPPSGEFVGPQPRWEEVTGQTVADLVEKGWVDAIHPDDRAATVAAWHRAVQEQAPYEAEHRLRLADGTYRRMMARAVPVRDAAGEIVEWVGVHTDVEELRKAASELAASEARFRTLFDAIADVILVYPLGPSGPEPFLAFNRAAVDFYGYSEEELRALTVQDLLVPERFDLEGAVDELRRNRTGTFQSTHLTKGGQRVPMHVNARLVEFDGRLCVVAIGRDDTERRQFQRELGRLNFGLERAVEERTAQVEAFAEDLKILHSITTAEHATPEAQYEAYLRAGCEMFELPIGMLALTPIDKATGERMYRVEAVVSPDPEAHVGLTMPLSEAFCDAVVEREETIVYADALVEAPEHPACAERGFRAFIGTPLYVEDEIVGTLNFVSTEPRTEGFASFERELVEVMAEAVSRRLLLDRAEREQAEAEAWYRSVVETVQEGLLLVDRDGRVLRSNPSAREILALGATEAEAAGRDLRQSGATVVDEEGAPVDPADLPERVAIERGEPVRNRVQGIVQPGQIARWYRVNATPVDRDQDGRPESVVVSFTDITELRATNEAFASLSSATAHEAHIGEWEWDLGTDRARWSPELYAVLGLGEGVVEPSIDGYLGLIPDPESRARVRGAVFRAVEEGGTYAVEHTIRRPDGEVRHVVGRGEAVVGEGGEARQVRGTVQDVTDSSREATRVEG